MSAPLVQYVDFHGSELATFEKDGERWVALRPVVKGMGIDWGTQNRKLEADPRRFDRRHMPTVGADGRTRDMTCIALRRYPMWLATISLVKVRPDIKERIELYQEASVEALYQFWTRGEATMDSVAEELKRRRQQQDADGNAAEIGRDVAQTRRDVAHLRDASVSIAKRLDRVPTDPSGPAVGYLNRTIAPKIDLVGDIVRELKDWCEERAFATYDRERTIIRALQDLRDELTALETATIFQAQNLVGVAKEHRSNRLSRLLSEDAVFWFSSKGRPAKIETRTGVAVREFVRSLLPDWWEASGRAVYEKYLRDRSAQTVLKLVPDEGKGAGA